MSKPDGGPAFPTSHSPEYPNEICGGMTMRDYFAAKVLAAQCGNSEMIKATMSKNGGDLYAAMRSLSRQSYVAADAMLAEREK